MTIINRRDAGTQGASSDVQRSPSRWESPCFADIPEYVEEGFGCWTPSVDIIDTKELVKVFVELPGMTKSDITIKVENGVLTLSGDRKGPTETDRARILRMERCYGGFCRSFSIGNQIDQDNISAQMENGMLTLTLPYKEGSKPKEIEVKIS